MYLVYEYLEKLNNLTTERMAINPTIYRMTRDGIAVRGLYDSRSDAFFIERNYYRIDGLKMELVGPVTGGIFLTGRCNSFSDFYYSKGTAHPDIAIKMREVNDKIEFCNNDDGDSDGPECDDAQAARALEELKILIVQICKEAQ